VTLKMPAFEWVHVQLHQQKGMISLSPPTICNSALDFNADVAITSPTIAITRKSQPFMIYLPICVGLIMHA
ncbi:hypothetical protein, partial [Escherichia coli]|uniref:hypothetical protein n=1 Tax=Escherichia coli TaxID=562 RepID=UPI003F519BF0